MPHRSTDERKSSKGLQLRLPQRSSSQMAAFRTHGKRNGRLSSRWHLTGAALFTSTSSSSPPLHHPRPRQQFFLFMIRARVSRQAKRLTLKHGPVDCTSRMPSTLKLCVSSTSYLHIVHIDVFQLDLHIFYLHTIVKNPLSTSKSSTPLSSRSPSSASTHCRVASHRTIRKERPCRCLGSLVLFEIVALAATGRVPVLSGGELRLNLDVLCSCYRCVRPDCLLALFSCFARPAFVFVFDRWRLMRTVVCEVLQLYHHQTVGHAAALVSPGVWLPAKRFFKLDESSERFSQPIDSRLLPQDPFVESQHVPVEADTLVP